MDDNFKNVNGSWQSFETNFLQNLIHAFRIIVTIITSLDNVFLIIVSLLLPFCYIRSMSTLVIKSIPKELHQFLKISAREHRRSLTQEVITILEQIMAIREKEEKVSIREQLTPEKKALLTFSGKRKLVPGYLDLYESGAFSGGTDSSVMISEDRGAS